MAEVKLDRYTLVLLKRPNDPPEFSEAELEVLQRRHLDHLASLYDQGMLAAGPLGEQPDVSLRGICLFRCDIAEARALMARDPMVLARRLEFEVFHWYTPPGVMSFNPPTAMP
jgi:uncharacterized protein